jgi:hypothetical protein
MLFSKDFFDLNLKFARKVSDITRQRFQRTLLEYTHLYLAFGLGHDFRKENTLWQEYLLQIMKENDQAEYTYRFYLERMSKQPTQKPEQIFGCFSYVLWDGNRVRLHFQNTTNESGVLQKRNSSARMAELKSMFGHLKKTVPVTSTVVGGSWLYNIEAYRRLFPAKYLESAEVGLDEFQFIALWGQFLYYDGNVRQHMTRMFLEEIEEQKTLEGVTSGFPYQVLRLESAIEDFYVYYGIA